MRSTKFINMVAIAGALAVGIGAFGAHTLKPYLSEYQISIFDKGIQYHFIHVLAMAAVSILYEMTGQIKFRQACWLFLAGLTCFSGSLYLLACRDLLPFSVAFAGPMTPLGGILLSVGWLTLLRK